MPMRVGPRGPSPGSACSSNRLELRAGFRLNSAMAMEPIVVSFAAIGDGDGIAMTTLITMRAMISPGMQLRKLAKSSTIDKQAERDACLRP
jgi:hypothetical protein